MEPLLKALAVSASGSAGGDAARRQLYLDIVNEGLAGDEEHPTFSAFECHKDAILPVLVKDCRESCHDIQLSALELVGHLVAMASSFEAPAFQPSQASSLWGAVAKVLGDEDSKRMSKVLALFAVSTNTMEPRLVAPSVAQLAPGVARSMRDESTVVRQQSAAAIHSLLGAAPGALALCDPGSTEDPEVREDTYWVRCLLRLCFDDAVVVRAGALGAAERAASMGYLRGNAGVAAWVLKALIDGSLSASMKRQVRVGATVGANGHAGELSAGERDASGASPVAVTSETPPRQATPQRVKQAIRAWAVYLSLADMTSLLQTRTDGRKKLMDDGTSLLSWLSGKFADSRESVRVQAVEAWEMFTVNMVAQMSRNNGESRSGYDQARGTKMICAERNAAVREAAMTSLVRLVASCPSRLFKPFWDPTLKGSGKKGNGVAELLQQLAGGCNGAVAQHQCARILAALMPCFILGPSIEPHPCLQSAGVNLSGEVQRLLTTLETLMKACLAPMPEDAASAIDTSPSTRSKGPVGDALVRLEALPTAGLIVSACIGGGKGKGKGKPALVLAAPGAARSGASGPQQACSDQRNSSVTPCSSKDGAGGGATSQPLLMLLGWLLGPGADGNELETPGITKDGETVATDSGSSAAEVGVGSATSAAADEAATVSSRGNLARWKAALLCGLVRALSRRLTLSRVKGTPAGRGPDLRPPEKGWLDTPLDAPLLGPETLGKSSSGGCAVCDECSLAGTVVREAVLRERGDGKVPLNLVLLEGVLVGRCGSRNRRSSHGKGGTAGSTGSICVLPKAFLSEALAFLPRGGAARLLKSLACSVLSAKKGGQEEEDSALMLLGRVWRAEAARVLSSWERCRLSSQSPSGDTAGMVFDGGVQGALSGEHLYGSVSAALLGGPRGSADRAKTLKHAQNEPQASESLHSDTAFALRFLVQTASSLFSRPPPEATWARSDGEGAAASAPAGHACGPAKNDDVHRSDGGELLEVVGVAKNGELEAGRAQRCWSRCSRRRLAAMQSVFGADAARLWRKFFEARRSCHIEPEGVSRLLKAIAKDCARCALTSTSTGVVVPWSGRGKDGGPPGGRPPFELEDQSNVVWGLDQRHSRDEGVGSARGSSAVASTTQGQNPAESVLLARKRGEQTRCGDDQIAAPPPFCSLPLLTAVALTLVTAAPREPDAKLRAWKAGLATLAWTLTAATPIASRPLAPTRSTLNLSATAAVTASAVAEEESAIAAGVRGCLAAVRSALAMAKVGSTTANPVFSLDKGSLAPVCRLLAVALSRSHAVGTTVSQAAAAAARSASCSEKSDQATPSATAAADTTATRAEAIVAAIPSVLGEARALILFVLSAVRKMTPSPLLLEALSPMVEGVLDLPASSSDADSLQSSLLDMWNTTFGKLSVNLNLAPSGPVVSWRNAFSASLLRRLSTLSERAEVMMPQGIVLPAHHDSTVVVAGAVAGEERQGAGSTQGGGSGDRDGGARENGEEEASVQVAPAAAVVGGLGGAAARRGLLTSVAAVRSGGVAGALPMEGARRSFMRQASTNPSPHRDAMATPKKRSPPPTSEAGSAAGGSTDKFVRIVGSGRGSSNKTPAKRAAVTTHTSLDGSQSMAPWEDGSQLPDTDPDSAPDLLLEEKQLPPPPSKHGLFSPVLPPSKTPSAPTSPATDSTTSGDAATSPGKRRLEEAESETVDPNQSAPSSAAPATACGVVDATSPPNTASERRVRPRKEPSAPLHDGGTATSAGASVTPVCAPGRAGQTPKKERSDGASAASSTAAAAADAAAARGEAAVSEIESAKRLEATMAAISKASNSGSSSSNNNSSGEAKSDDEDSDDDDDGVVGQSETSEMRSSVQRPLSDQNPGAGGGGGGGGCGSNGGVNELLQDFRSLTSRLQAARPAMSPEQFEEVGALLQKIAEK
ncbi:unnamed protein product [Scytosiphon promiscuus]